MLTNFHGNPISLSQSKFFFIFCPNNSGKTILSQYLATQLGAYLPPNGNNEGQGLPAVSQMMRSRPWDPTYSFDWPQIRKAWTAAAGGRIFVEASPPNLMRSDAIRAAFGHDSTAIISICSPYQQIASALRRYRTPGTRVGGMVKEWLFKAHKIRLISQSYPQFPLIRHEDFVARPAVLNQTLQLPVVPFDGVGKRGSDASGVDDLHIRTTLFLNEDEIDDISARLVLDGALLSDFGYVVRSGQDLIESSRISAPEEFARARSRRAEWDAGAG